MCLSNETLLVHWPTFGPYHIARLSAAQEYFRKTGVRVAGLEVAGSENTYRWNKGNEVVSFERIVAFPDCIFEDLPAYAIWRRFHQILKNLRPTVVAINGYSSKDALILLLLAHLHHCPAIVMSESKFDDSARDAYRESAKRLLIRQFSAGLCGGKPHRDYLVWLGMSPGRVFMGYDAVDNEYFSREADRARGNRTAYEQLPGLKESNPFFLASARFIPRKNLDRLLLAYAYYRMELEAADRSPWRLVVLGDGEEKDFLVKLIREKGIEGVSLPGFRQIDELPAYYATAGAFIHPALQEQWGLVVNEAMAAGLPVLVSSRSGCASSLVKEGVNGFRFDPENTEELAYLMGVISSDEVDLVAMGQASRGLIREWGLQKFAKGMLSAYRAALKD